MPVLLLRLKRLLCSRVACQRMMLAESYQHDTRVLFSVQSDIFSFGVVLLELISGRAPVDMSRPRGQESLVLWVSARVRKFQIGTLIEFESHLTRGH